MKYTPSPIDTSRININNGLMELIDLLAKNTHEVWAKQRIEDGWTYGEERNDINKTHPCLVPYEELSESEKNYDINTSLEVLKVIYALGYSITKTE